MCLYLCAVCVTIPSYTCLFFSEKLRVYICVFCAVPFHHCLLCLKVMCLHLCTVCATIPSYTCLLFQEVGVCICVLCASSFHHTRACWFKELRLYIGVLCACLFHVQLREPGRSAPTRRLQFHESNNERRLHSIFPFVNSFDFSISQLPRCRLSHVDIYLGELTTLIVFSTAEAAPVQEGRRQPHRDQAAWQVCICVLSFRLTACTAEA